MLRKTKGAHPHLVEARCAREYAEDDRVELEVLEPGQPIYVMGPKEVFDEYLDGEVHGELSPDDGGDPFVPDTYDGRVLEGPGLDFNFEITSLRFSRPGSHELCWRPGRWESNVLQIVVQ